MKRLVKNEILSDLNFSDLNVCVNCIKDKQTNKTCKEERSPNKYSAS